jgi:UDP-glucuronate decarboxylase
MRVILGGRGRRPGRAESYDERGGTGHIAETIREEAASSQAAAVGTVVAEDLASICARAEASLRLLSGKTVLVAGAAGFLPSYVVDALAWANDHLLERRCAIVCLDNFATGTAARLQHLESRPDVLFLAQDVAASVAVDGDVDYVVHGASIASPPWYRRYPLETIDVNVSGTRNLLELARERGARGFLYLSSSEVYGDPPPERIPTTEEYWGNVSCTGPRAPYDESKRLAETLCTTYHRLYGTPVVIVRPFNVYGPRLRLDDGRVLPDFLRDALAGRELTILSDGRATRSFCYVADFVAALLLLLTADVAGEPFNVGNDEEVTIREVAEALARIAAAPGVRFATSEDELYLVDNPSRRAPDLRKVTATIDWKPEVSLQEGLRRTYEHYREDAGA